MIISLNDSNKWIYFNAVGFLAKDCKYNELKEVFGEHLEEYFKDDKFKFPDEEMSVEDLANSQELCEAIAEQLNSYGWSDEEVIKAVLKQRNGKYILNYVPENHAQEDYFEVWLIDAEEEDNAEDNAEDKATEEKLDYCESCGEHINQIDLGDGSFGCPLCMKNNHIITFYYSEDTDSEDTDSEDTDSEDDKDDKDDK